MSGAAVGAIVVVLACLLAAGCALRALAAVQRVRRALQHERVVRAAATALAGATDRPAVRDAVLAATVELLGGRTRSWRVDGDPAGTVAQEMDAPQVQTLLDAAERNLFPLRGGVTLLPGPSLLHANLGVASSDVLVMIALAPRGAACEAAVVSTPARPDASTVEALELVAGVMGSALDRLDVGEVLLERRSERRLRLMLRYAADVICILDNDLTIVHVTQAVEPMLGLAAPELLGMNWLDMVAEPDRQAARDLVTLAQSGRSARAELRLHTDDVRVPYVDTVVTKVIDEDLMGFVVTCHDITERHELEQQLMHEAFHDSLTGLANRALFRDRLGHAMARARGADDYAVLFLDLDDFKTVNDSLGHAAGDALLCEMTRRLCECLRDGDTAARLGGDEFAVLLEDIESAAACEAIAARIVSELSLPFELFGTEISTSVSIGVVRGSAAPTAEELMRNADLALYDAKNAGKQRYSMFAQEMHDAVIVRLALMNDLRYALDRDELVVYYQPLVNLVSGDVTGLEALVRWNHPQRGMLQPGEFIALAEESGLIVPLGRAVLQTALQSVADWQRAHATHRDLRIAVNVSGRQLQDPDFVGDVRAVLDTTGIDPTTVVLEITETVLVPGDTDVLARLRALAEMGVHLYVDDFGTGYSSLSYLQTLPFVGLKLAQEFVESLPLDATDAGVVRTIQGLADSLGLRGTVAEGIERSDQWETLLSLGYTSGQGYHLAVPMPGELVPHFLSGRRRAGDTPWLGEINQSLHDAIVAGPGSGPAPRRALAPRQRASDDVPTGSYRD